MHIVISLGSICLVSIIANGASGRGKDEDAVAYSSAGALSSRDMFIIAQATAYSAPSVEAWILTSRR